MILNGLVCLKHKIWGKKLFFFFLQYYFILSLSFEIPFSLLNEDTDLPLILILSVYTDFLPFEFGKIQIFFLKIWQNTDFFEECERIFFIFSLVIQIFSLNY